MPDAPKLTPGEILFVATPPRWREACLSVPAMRAFQRLGVRVKVLCPDKQLAFWKASGFGDGIAYPAGASAGGIAGRLSGVDAALLWEAGPVADACAKAGVPRRLGLPAKGLEKRLTERIERVVKPGPIEHRVRFYLDIAEELGAEGYVAENFTLVEMGVEREGGVLLAPDSDEGPHYEWPLERWVALAGDLQEAGLEPVVGRGGRLGQALAGALEGAEAVDLGFPALEELARYRLCVAADGALPHLAAHVGTACVVLFGPGEPEWLRPLGKRHVIVRRKVECSPCFAPKCRMDLRCQTELEAEEVKAAILRLAANSF